MADEFNVVIFYPDGSWEYFLRHATAENAVKAAKRCVDNLGERGIVERVMITDSGDDTNFLWERGKGVVYPEPAP
jgi:fructose 1,6-bisphosphatase